MAVVDTSFLIALTDADDHFHADALRDLPRGEHLLVAWEVWTEFCQWVLRFAPPTARAQVLDSVVGGPFDVRHVTDLETLERLVQGAEGVQTRLARAGQKPLSLFDLVVCTVAARQRDAVLTFDEGIRFAIRSRLFPGARLAN